MSTYLTKLSQTAIGSKGKVARKLGREGGLESNTKWKTSGFRVKREKQEDYHTRNPIFLSVL